MLQSLRERKLLVPFIMVAITLPILVALGNWQLERRVWKEKLIADMVSRAKSPEVAIESLLDASGAFVKPPEELEYTAVRAQGRFLHDKEQHLYAPDPREGPGVEIITPLELAGSGSIILVNRGYVPDRFRDRSLRAEGLPEGSVEVLGLVRAIGRPNSFSPPHDQRTGLWFWRDFDGMAAAAGVDDAGKTMRGFLDSTMAAPGGWPRGGATRFDLPNRHLEYALTWFGLAIALAAIFLIYAMTRLREPRA
jgi:surfeit locus 1 family protein